MSRVCGIDPGLSGALAFGDLVEHGDSWAWENTVVYDMPVRDYVDGRPVPDPLEIHEILSNEQPGLIIIEHVEARPRSGARSEWRFAQGFGATLTACQLYAGRQPRTHLVRPAIWKAALGVTSDKNTSLALARSSFPRLGPQLSRQKDDGRAEALLLLEYHRRVLVPRGEMEVA